MITAGVQAAKATPPPDILPTLFGAGEGLYGVQSRNFVLSFLLHTLALLLLLTSGFYISEHHEEIKQQVMAVIDAPIGIPLPPSAKQMGGGGGGGDRDKLQAPKGAAPRFAAEQLAPPAIVIRNPEPKLPVEPTVVGPPDLKLPQLAQTGDPLASIMSPPSNGTGYGGGIGSGNGGGVGSGSGPGVGPGHGGGFGGGAYQVGGGVSAPKMIYAPDPEFSDEARKAKYQGTVTLAVVIGPDGRVHGVEVRRSLGMGLDEKAVEAVKTWKFEPGRKDGQPVAVIVNVEVNFRLY
ncbi:MAG: energy transducer TonB [Terriglobales bacterium]|jgi:TonB family protein